MTEVSSRDGAFPGAPFETDCVQGARPRAPALVVVLDGAVLRSDLLLEGALALVATNPFAALLSLDALWHGIAAFKAKIAAHKFDLATLPWNFPFIGCPEAEYARGTAIYLASASDRCWVESIAAHFGCFTGWFASDGRVNLKGRAKADIPCQAFGAGSFDYAGNELAGVPISAVAASVSVVNGSTKIQRMVRSRWPDSAIVDGVRPSLKVYGRAVRTHRWLKNLLVLPLAAHQFAVQTADICFVAFISFSLCAPSAYVLNDLIDLGNDRMHATKRFRPLAAGIIPIQHDVALIPLLLADSLFFALPISVPFVVIIVSYFILRLAYSLYINQQLMIAAYRQSKPRSPTLLVIKVASCG